MASRQCRKELDVANQMRQTKLLKFAGIFDISTEKVAYNRTPVGLSQDFLQDFGRTRFSDIEKNSKLVCKKPMPSI